MMTNTVHLRTFQIGDGLTGCIALVIISRSIRGVLENFSMAEWDDFEEYFVRF